MNINDVYGTLYSQGDGSIDPSGLVTSLTRAATNKGAKVCKLSAYIVMFKLEPFVQPVGYLHVVMGVVLVIEMFGD
jgi:hypothetical protein